MLYSFNDYFYFGENAFVIFYFALVVFYIACLWKIFEKADFPGWASIIPIYNTIIMLKIAQRPVWWIVLMFIPLVNVVIGILVMLDIAKAFGKEPGFAIGLILLPWIFIPILAFDSSVFQTIRQTK